MTPIIPLQHYEHGTSALYALTIDPIKDLFDYFIPFVGAWMTGHRPLMLCPSQEGLMPQEETKRMVKEINDLTKAAGIYRTVVPYFGLNHRFAHSGGPLSLTAPALLIPEQAFFRKNGPSFGQDQSYRGSLWTFSDDETRFLLARELAQLGINSSLLRLIVKIAFVTSLIAVFTLPFTTLQATLLLISAVAFYILIERLFQSASDKRAIEILKKMGIENGKEVAKGVLEKLQKQNLYLREQSALVRLYINAKGDNALDLLYPRLSERIHFLT
jgi:hypothetical protein